MKILNFVLLKIVKVMQKKKVIINMLHALKAINFAFNVQSLGMVLKNVRMKLIKILKNGKKIKLSKDAPNVNFGLKKIWDVII